MAKIKQTIASINWQGQDVSSSLAPYLEELTYTDNIDSGSKDELTMRLNNSSGKFWGEWLPQKGDELRAQILFRNIGEKFTRFSLGSFTLDEVDFSFSPKTCFVRALSYADIDRDRFKKSVSRAFEMTSLSGLLTMLAAENSLAPHIDCPDVFFDRIEMRGESLEAFCTRLAKQYGCNFAIKGSRFVFLQDTLKTTRKICLSHLSGGQIKYKPRVRVVTAVMEYYDPQQKKTLSWTEKKDGKGETRKIHGIARSLAEAKTRCQNTLNTCAAEEITADISLAGMPLSAGECVELVGIGKLEGIYAVQRVVHTLSATKGWTTRANLKHKEKK